MKLRRRRSEDRHLSYTLLYYLLLLRELTTLNILLQSSAQTRAADPSAFETEAHASAVLSLTREVMHAKDFIHACRLSFQVDKHLYDIVDVVQCLHAEAVSTLLGLFLTT
jgi:hypothetical protein